MELNVYFRVEYATAERAVWTQVNLNNFLGLLNFRFFLYYLFVQIYVANIYGS